MNPVKHRLVSTLLTVTLLLSLATPVWANEITDPPSEPMPDASQETPPEVPSETTPETTPEATPDIRPNSTPETIPERLPEAIEETSPPSSNSVAPTGSITTTLRFDYPQTLTDVKERDITLALSNSDGSSIGQVSLDTGTSQIGSYPVKLTLKNAEGVPVTTETQAGFWEVVISDLPIGTYNLTFSGTGYQPCEIINIELKDFSKHVVLGTSDVFLLGDVTKDGKIDQEDVAFVSAALKSPWTLDSGNRLLDLNGDGTLDVSDLAYVTRQAKANAEDATIFNANLIVTDPAHLLVLPDDSVTMDKSTTDLFQGNTEVTFTSKDPNASQISIPLDFQNSSSPPELQQVQITTTTEAGAVEAGNAEVTYLDADGKEQTKTVPFGGTAPADVHFLSRSGENNTITIDLGERVPVKKITIIVTKVVGQNGTVSFAVVEQIKFLQDIVPEKPMAPNTKVKRVDTYPAHQQITLKWQDLPNVTGYRVTNTEAKNGKPVPEMTVSTASATVTGLVNLVEYTFTVTPISDNAGQTWAGTPSDPVTAAPKPASVPNPPNFVTVTEQNAALLLSWKKTEAASYYQVFYKAKDETTFAQWGGDLTATQTLLTGLRNGVLYELYVLAGNDIGLSGKSNIVEGTPKAVDYNEPVGIPTEGRLPSSLLSSIKLAEPYNVATSQYPNQKFDPNWVADGDYSTHWTSQSYGDGGGWWHSKEIQFTFTKPVDLSSIVYVPRLDGTYRNNLKAYTITVWDQDGKATKLVDDAPVRNSPSSTGFAVLPFAPAKGITRIDVAVGQQAYTSVSLSEIIFLTYDPARDLDAQISALFADEAKTALASGVDEARITSLSQTLAKTENYYLYPATMKDELALALELLNGKNTDRILRGIESRGNGTVNQGQGGSLLQPLGFAALANQQITVYASGIPSGKTVQLIATQNHAEANTWSAPVAEISNGRNVVIIPKIGTQNTPRGGSLYLTYSGENASNITLHLRRATQIPLLDLSDATLTASEQKNRITSYLTDLGAYKNTNTALNVTELSFPSVLLSIPADKALAALNSAGAGDPVETLYQDLLTWNEFMETAYRTQGIDDSSNIEVRQNIRSMQMFGNAFMYAAGSHVGIGPGSCGALLMGKPTSATGTGANRLFGWGIAHEVGHNMDKLGKAEITNNIYALVMQTRDSGKNIQTSRLEGNTYKEVFAKTAAGYPGTSSNGSVALALYWQLHLAYDDGNQSFWNAFFKAWKALPTGGSYEDRVALAAGQASGHDLTEFFTQWGMRLSDTTKNTLATYTKEDRAVQYLSDQSRRERLAGGTPVTGSITATTTLKPADANTVQNTVEITVNTNGLSDTARMQGYEILRDGKSVAFTTTESYSDTIGSANNIAYTYSVQAYDILGNKVGAPANAGQVRIAYDKTVAATVTKQDNIWTATMSESTAVSGIKVTVPTGTLPTTGSFTVEVSDDGDKRTAKVGTFAQNDVAADSNAYIAYFTKPGADATDTRIWTYDAKTVTLTDQANALPANAKVELISYAGDNIGFYGATEELGSVGTLLSDFSYSDNGNTVVIPAGTVVITGTYRGDPVYNTVRVYGEYVTSKMTEDDTKTNQPTKVPLPGYSLLFAEIPADGEVSDISDGFFLFVPDMKQLETLLEGLKPATSGTAQECILGDRMPARLQAELWRTDTPNGTSGSSRLTSSTLWLPAPSYDSLPSIQLKGGSSE